MRVEKSSLRDAAGQALTEIRVPARLAPGGQARLSVPLALDSRTPPGVYKAELVLGGERRYATFNVAELTRAQVTPQTLVFLGPPGSRAEKTLFVTNAGNVPLQGGDVSAVVLEQDNFECRVVRNAVKRLDDPSWDDFVGAVSDELKRAYDEIAFLRVRTRSRPEEIPPGATAAFVLDFQLPSSSHKGSTQRGILRLFDFAVGILINPGGENAGGEPSSEPRRGRKDRSAA
jgi:hypothetical protein